MQVGDDVGRHGAVDVEGAVDQHDHEAREQRHHLTQQHDRLLLITEKIAITHHNTHRHRS